MEQGWGLNIAPPPEPRPPRVCLTFAMFQHQSGPFLFTQAKFDPLTATFSTYRLVIAQCMHPYCSVIFLLLMSNIELLGDLVDYLVYMYLGRPCSPASKDMMMTMMMMMLLMIMFPQVTLGAQLLS